MLNQVVKVTRSECGFIGEVFSDRGEKKFQSFSSIGACESKDFESWNVFIEELLQAEQAMVTEFSNKHPSVSTLAGIKLYSSGKQVGVIGLVNRKKGYKGKFLKEWSSLFDVLGEVIGHYRLQKELKDSNTYLDLALDGAGLGIWDWNLEDNSVHFDARWAEMLGLNVSDLEMSIKTWEERVHPDDLNKCYADIKNYMDGETTYYENIHRMKHEDGHWVYILDRGRFSGWDDKGKPTRFTGTHFDISEAKSRELELDLVLRNAKVGIWHYNPQNQKLVWDESMYALYDICRENFSGDYDAWEKTLLPEHKERAVQDLQDALDGKCDFDTKFPIKTKDGSIRYIGARGEIERDENGNPVMMTGINWDLTKEQTIQTLLEKQASFLENTIQSLPAVFYAKDLEGRFLQVNKSFCSLFNKNESEFIGKKNHELFSKEIADVFEENDKEIRDKKLH